MPDFKTSFIPKKTIARAKVQTGTPVDLFLVIAVLIFLLAALAAGGVFAYQFKVKSDITKKSEQLALARKEIDPNLIAQLESLDLQLGKAKEVLGTHQAMTTLFDKLEQNTLLSVQFDSFAYSRNKDVHQITMNGEAKNYMSLALQSDVFSKAGFIKNAVFSNLNLNTAGNVQFQMVADVDPSIFTYTPQDGSPDGSMDNATGTGIGSSNTPVSTQSQTVPTGTPQAPATPQ
ncbi:MAG TPA: hypothetical protein VFM02_03825 [Candidatus Paceibacterota bacterium]|nr:hypothetical protein [Candidatus Paceibacterota bacterium]